MYATGGQTDRQTDGRMDRQKQSLLLPSVRAGHNNVTKKIKYILCSKKRDHVFDDKLNYNCPFTTILAHFLSASLYFSKRGAY